MNHDSGWDPDPIILFYMTMLKQHPENFRVSYLIKEQIENEGWKESDKIKNFFRKGNYKLEIYDNYRIIIRKDGWYEENTIYKGKCLSINEFRTICKLLGI